MHLKIVQGTHKWHWYFKRPSCFSVIDQNSHNVVSGSITQEQLGLP